MKIKVTLIGPLRKYFNGDNTKIMEFDEGIVVKDVLEDINISISRFMITINGERETIGCELSEGDEVVIFPVVSGG